MKQIIFIIFTIVLQVQASAQFTGIGPIKVGSSEASFLGQLQDEFNTKLDVYTDKESKRLRDEWTSFLLASNLNLKIYQLQGSETVRTWPVTLNGEKARKLAELVEPFHFYYVPAYQVGSISLKDIFVTVRDGQVQMIEMNYSNELIAAAREKYSPAMLLDTAYDITCKFVMTGVPKSEKVIKHITTWKTDDVDVLAVQSLDYNSECKQVLVSSIQFASTDILKYIMSINDSDKQKKDAEMKANKTKLKEKI